MELKSYRNAKAGNDFRVEFELEVLRDIQRGFVECWLLRIVTERIRCLYLADVRITYGEVEWKTADEGSTGVGEQIPIT